MGRLSLLLGLLLLAGCATSARAPSALSSAESSAFLASAVPAESFDRTDLPCYYGPVW